MDISDLCLCGLFCQILNGEIFPRCHIFEKIRDSSYLDANKQEVTPTENSPIATEIQTLLM